MNTLSIFNPRFSDGLLDAFDEMNQTMGNFFPTSKNFAARMAAPKVDVKETKNAYVMEMDLPGLSDKDVEISLKDNLLSVSSVKKAKAEKKEEAKEEGEYLIRERSSMEFMRRFTLPNDIDSEAVAAKFANGVLTSTIPRKVESAPRTIAITSND